MEVFFTKACMKENQTAPFNDLVNFLKTFHFLYHQRNQRKKTMHCKQTNFSTISLHRKLTQQGKTMSLRQLHMQGPSVNDTDKKNNRIIQTDKICINETVNRFIAKSTLLVTKVFICLNALFSVCHRWTPKRTKNRIYIYADKKV